MALANTLAGFMGSSLYGDDDTQPTIKKPLAIPRPNAVAAVTPADPAAAPVTDPTAALPGGARNLKNFGDIYPTIGQQTNAATADAAAKQARTGGGAFDPANPDGPSALAAVSLGQLGPNGTGPATVLNFARPTPDPAGAADAAPKLTSRDNAGPLPALPIPGLPGATGSGGGIVAPPAGTVAPATAVSQNGTPIGVGQNINGVQTFSDGSGSGPGAVPRTMTDQQIADVGKGINTIPDANFVRPAPGVAASIATGGAVTPEVGAPNLARPDAAVTGTFDPSANVADAERGARSDLASILNEDPRSALGIAARNARISLSGLKGSRMSRYNGGQTPYEEAIGSLIQRANQPVIDAQQTGLSTQRDAGETARENVRAAAGIQDAALRRPDAKQFQLGDGTTGQMGADGRVHVVLDEKGNPVTEAVGKPAIDQAAYGKTLQDNLHMILGLDPITGMMKDPVTGKTRMPTPQELSSATDSARTLTQRAFQQGNGPAIPNPATSAKPTLTDFISAAKAAPQNAGKSEQELTQYYKNRYGT